MIFLFTKHFSGDRMKEDGMDDACGIYEGEDKCIQGFGGEAWKT